MPDWIYKAVEYWPIVLAMAIAIPLALWGERKEKSRLPQGRRKDQ